MKEYLCANKLRACRGWDGHVIVSNLEIKLKSLGNGSKAEAASPQARKAGAV
jgi:hypothetical protein